jgi:hypothetical protein
VDPVKVLLDKGTWKVGLQFLNRNEFIQLVTFTGSDSDSLIMESEMNLGIALAFLEVHVLGESYLKAMYGISGGKVQALV